MSAEHKAKIAKGVRAYHKKCRECKNSKPKSKVKGKPRVMPKPDQGKRLRQAVDRIERRAAIHRDTAFAKRLKGR